MTATRPALGFPASVLGFVIALSLLSFPTTARAADPKAPMGPDRLGPIPRMVVGLAGGFSLIGGSGKHATFSYLTGIEVELSLASPGLSPLLQAGYMIRNSHWNHTIPIDIGGRYSWLFGKYMPYLSGGLSVLVMDKRLEGGDGGASHNWEVYPLVYADIGMRIMFKRHLGLEIRAECRTYIVVTMVGLKIGLAL